MSRRATEMVERGNLEMYAAGLETRVDILEAKLADIERRIRMARKAALGQNVSRELWELLDLRFSMRRKPRGGR